MRDALARLAAGAPAPVFTLVAEDGHERARDLRLDERVRVVDSPRHAAVLVVVGRLPRALWHAAAVVHDEMPSPRTTVVWGDEAPAILPGAARVDAHEDVAAVIHRLHVDLLTRARDGDPDVLMDVDPNPWRGVGPFGQGGKGMTGGTPYGRPMAGRAPDRDGLQLDQLPLPVGPFLPCLPPGLSLTVALQGDVVQDCSVGDNPFTRWPGDAPLVPDESPFERALREPVAIADLELARARHHLGWIADGLRLHGLPALAARALRLRRELAVDDASGRGVDRLLRRIDRSQLLRWSVGAVGTLTPDRVAGLGLGPVARAAGVVEDARLLDPAYERLGFAPVTHAGGDAPARWRQRLDELRQSIDLAHRAGEATTSTPESVEGPRGPVAAGRASPSARLVELVPDVVVGLEWGDAVATIASLDIDLEEAARHPVSSASGEPGAA